MELFIIGVLIFLGALLLVVEIALIPGIGLPGILGVVSMGASLVYSFTALGNLAGWITLLIIICISVALFLWAVYGNSLDKIALKKNINSTVENPDASSLHVGDRGVTVTRLALIGEADFSGSIVEVTSCGGFIDENTEIEIVRIVGNVISVKKTENITNQ